MNSDAIGGQCDPFVDPCNNAAVEANTPDGSNRYAQRGFTNRPPPKRQVNPSPYADYQWGLGIQDGRTLEKVVEQRKLRTVAVSWSIGGSPASAVVRHISYVFRSVVGSSSFNKAGYLIVPAVTR
jgi:hypothetical protein